MTYPLSLAVFLHHNTFHFATSNVTMAEKTPITAQEKGTIEALFQEGHSAREIGRRLGVSDSTVRYNLRKLKEYGSMDTYHDQVVHRRPPTEMIVHWSTVSKQLRPYSIHNHILDEVTSAKYLGVHIDSKVNFNAHVDATVKKANSNQAFLNRTFRHCNQKIKQATYTTYVRPIVEYAASTWDPHTKRNIDKLEMVQRRGARYVTGN